MAARTISTRIAIEGEDEFKRSVAGINSSLGVLKSELSKVKAEYKENANSMDALKAKGEILGQMQAAYAGKIKEVESALANAKAVQQGYAAQVADCEAKVAAAEAELQRYAQGTSAAGKSQEALNAELAKYRAELERAEQYNEAAQRGVNGWQKQLNTAKRDLTKTNTEVKKQDQYMDEAKRSADGCATSIDQYGKKVKSAGTEAEQYGAAVKRAGEQTAESAGALDALVGTLAVNGLKGALDTVKAAIEECVGAFTAYESAITGVYKTVDGTKAQLAGLSDGIRQMALEIPAGTTEIANVAQAAGQLGIATDSVLDFTRVMIDLGQSTNLSAEAAASALAKFANVTGMSADDYGRLGATIVDLGNHFATTEADIVSMATRLASTGTLTGLSEAQIMALSTALSSLGIEAEAGGSAMSKLLKKFEVMVATGAESLEDFAQIAGMSADEFSRAWKQDAVGALSAFLKGLGQVDQAGGSAVATLQELGLKEVRLSNATLALASSGDLLTNAVDMANSAWAENTALTTEAGLRYGTTESKIAIMNNAFNELKITVGEQLAPALGEALDAGTELAQWAADLAAECPALVSLIAAVAAGLGVFTAAMVSYTLVTKVAIPLVKAFTAALMDNPFGLVAVALAALVAGVATFIGSLGEAPSAVEELNQKLKETAEAADKTVQSIEDDTAAKLANLEAVERLIPQIEVLNGKSSRTKEEQAKLNTLVDAANKLYPGLIGKVNELTGAYNFNKNAIYDNIEALKAELQAEANRDIAAEKYKEAAALRLELADAQIQLNEAEAAKQDIEAEIEQRKAAGEGYVDLTHKLSELEATTTAVTATMTDCQEQIDQAEAEAGKAIDAASDLAAANNGLADSAEKAADGITDAGDAADDTSSRFTALNTVLDKVKGGYDLLKKAQDEMSESGYLSLDTVANMLEKYPELAGYLEEVEGGYQLAEGALQDYIVTQRAEYQIAYDNAAAAAQAIVNAEADKLVSIDATTQGVKDQLRALAALYDSTEGITSVFGDDYKNSDDFYAHSEIVQNRGDAIRSVLASMEKSENSLAGFDRVTASLGRDSGSKGGRGSSSKGEKGESEEEKRVKAYKAAMDEYQYLRDTDQISEADYYTKMEELRDLYLTAGSEEWRSVTVKLHDWKQGAYDRDLNALNKSLENEEITEEEHLQGLKDLQTQYLTEDSDQWWENRKQQEADEKAIYDRELKELDHRRAMDEIGETEYYQRKGELAERYLKDDLDEYQKWEEERYAYQKGAYDRALKELNENLEAGKISLEEHLQGLKDLQAQHLTEDSEQWADNLKAQEKARQAMYDGERADQDYFHNIGLTSDRFYYQHLKELRDKYLEEGSVAWRKAMEELYKWEEAQRKSSAAAEQKAVEDAQKRRTDLIKRYTDERIAQIKREQKAEEDRIHAEIDAINEEIAARRRLREEESAETAIAKAKKTLDAAQGQLAYARDENTRKELEKEVQRAQDAYDKAIREKEDNDWYYQKQQEIEGKQAELNAVKDRYQELQDQAESYAAERLAKKEAAEQAARRESDAFWDKEIARMEAQAAAGSLAAASKAVSQVVNHAVSQATTNNNRVNINMPSAPLSSWQLEQGVIKAMDKLASR